MVTRSASLCAFVLVFLSAVCFGQRPAPDAKAKETHPKVDWSGLRALLENGEYAKAKAAADAILESVTPDRKSPDYLPRCVDTIDALMRRGFCELQLGELDPAEATFVKAQEWFKDREFVKQIAELEKQVAALEKQIAMLEKQGVVTSTASAQVQIPKKAGPLERLRAIVDPLIDLDLRLIELQNLRAAVVLERLRQLNAVDGASSRGTAEAPPAATVEQVRAWVDTIRGLVDSTAVARKDLAERFGRGGPAVVGSPHKQALMSSFHPELIAGIVAFEASCLPFEIPAAPVSEKPPTSTDATNAFALDGSDRGALLEKSLRHLEAASKTLQKAFAAAVPSGLEGAPADKRLEAEVLLVQLSLARCGTLLKNGDLPAASREVDEIFRIHKDLAALRKVDRAESHPELLLPLLLATEVGLAQAEEHFKAGMIDEARVDASRAAAFLARASALPLAQQHARRSDLARLASEAEHQQKRFDASVVTTDAAEVASRRIRRAVERAAPSL